VYIKVFERGFVQTRLQMKWVRGLDGLLCFGFAIFFTIATIQDFYLPSVAVTDIVYPHYKDIIIENMKGVAPDVCMGPSKSHPSVAPTCDCLGGATGADFDTGLGCIRTHHGLPAEQKQIGWINANFCFFHIFLVASIYQLVIRNSMELDMNRYRRDIQIGVVVMFTGVVASITMCLFNFEHGVQLYVLLNFMPHQILLLIVAYIMYNNAHFDEISEEYQDHYKKAIFSGVYNAATMPFMAVLVCIMNSWTTMPMLQFVYTIVILINVIEMAYNCVYIDANKDSGTRSIKQDTTNNAAKYRMRQAIYLLLITLLVTLSITILMYFPQHTDTIHRVVGIVFIGLLWVLHIIFDCTKSSLDSYQHEKCFNQYDGFVAMIRYALFAFSLYMVWGT
jgi:hypothetical protein